MLIKDESVPQERLYQGKVPAEEIAAAFRTDDTPATLWKGEGVLDENALADVVENLEAMDELAPLLRIVDARQHVGLEPVLDAEVALEVDVEELVELLLKCLCSPTLCKRKVLVIGELTEVLAQYVLKVV